MVIRSHGSIFPTDPLSAILLLRRKDPPCSNPGRLARPGCRPFPHALCPSCQALPATLFLWWPQLPQYTLPSLSPSRAPASSRPGFIISSCLSLLLLWSFGSPDSIIAHRPALSLQFFTASLHHIKSISGPDRVGPRCAIAMFYFGLGPAGGNTNLLDTSSPKAVHRPTRPPHDNSPSR